VEVIEKYGKHLLPILLGGIALYDRFIVLELEMDIINRDKEHIQIQLKEEIEERKNIYKRLRRIECE